MKKLLFILVILVSVIIAHARIVDTLYYVGGGMVNDSVYGLVLKHKTLNNTFQSSKIDTIFRIDYEEKTKCEVEVPISVYNKEATPKENYYAWKGETQVLIKKYKKIEYIFPLKRKAYNQTLVFNKDMGKNIIMPSNSFSINFAWELIAVFLFSFIICFQLLVKAIKNRNKKFEEGNMLLFTFLSSFCIFAGILIFTDFKNNNTEIIQLYSFGAMMTTIIFVLLPSSKNYSGKVVFILFNLISFIIFAVVEIIELQFLPILFVFLGMVLSFSVVYLFNLFYKKRRDLNFIKQAHYINKEFYGANVKK